MESVEHTSKWLACARATMQLESEAIARAATRLDGGFCGAVRLILGQPGKVVVTGLGKSGHIARKIVATLCSTGTPAVFLHPTEAAHGDLGVYAPGDSTLILSKSGTTRELVQLVPALGELGSPIIGILGNPASPLAANMDAVLDASVNREADPSNLAPTASTSVALALGDALAITLMRARNFTAEDFQRWHPGGALGAGLRLRVRQAMHAPSEVAWVGCGESLRQVVIAMTVHPLGAACVLNPDGRLAGLITDGDLRRTLEKHDDIRTLHAADVMTPAPVTVDPDARVLDALRLMEDRPSQISVLPVVSAGDGLFLGLLRLHDIYQAAVFTG
ncbi:MAG: KpsF/GutQ family sugar-phosphate isomerase [Candidatus Solibacter usitatus]|nr:KpsF/GutQ family sugar-phosphate isomerase [Candidatus Solibacter usitatus]